MMAKSISLRELLRTMDLDRSGGVSADEFAQSGVNRGTAEEIIGMGDENGNRTLDTEREFANAITRIGYNENNPLNISVKDFKQKYLSIYGGFKPGMQGYSIYGDKGKVKVQRGYSYRTLPEKTRLHVNNTSEIPYRIKKTRIQGEVELQELAASRETTQEEAWLYVRGSHRNTGEPVEYWYEHGRGDGSHSISIDGAVLNDVVQQFNIEEISTYHIHPLGLTEQRHTACLEFPSANDYTMASLTAHELHVRNMTHYVYDDRVVTPQGMVILVPNREGLEKLKEDEELSLPFELGAIYFAHATPVFGDNAFCSVQMPKEFTKSISSNLIKVEYFKK